MTECIVMLILLSLILAALKMCVIHITIFPFCLDSLKAPSVPFPKIELIQLYKNSFSLLHSTPTEMFTCLLVNYG